MQKEFPLVIRKSGKMFVPTFPVTLKGGDQLILTRETVRTQVPKGDTWTIEGYYWGAGGPLIPRHKVNNG